MVFMKLLCIQLYIQAFFQRSLIPSIAGYLSNHPPDTAMLTLTLSAVSNVLIKDHVSSNPSTIFFFLISYLFSLEIFLWFIPVDFALLRCQPHSFFSHCYFELFLLIYFILSIRIYFVYGRVLAKYVLWFLCCCLAFCLFD